jgi:uncharacterized membrane-anchored protein YhcB (DUF1043 family)
MMIEIGILAIGIIVGIIIGYNIGKAVVFSYIQHKAREQIFEDLDNGNYEISEDDENGKTLILGGNQ